MRELKQMIYEHGGSRIYTHDGNDEHRDLFIDTYHTKEFAIAARKFTEDWLKQHATKDNDNDK